MAATVPGFKATRASAGDIVFGMKGGTVFGLVARRNLPTRTLQTVAIAAAAAAVGVLNGRLIA